MQKLLLKPVRLLSLLALLNLGVAAAPRAALADIALGLAGPLTGSNAQNGLEMRVGMEAAIQDINSHGGVLHQKLVLLAEDDGCDNRQAISAAKRMVEHGIHFVYGHYCSGTTLVASPVYAESGVLEITVSVGAMITDQGFDGLFRLNGRDSQQGRIMADFLAAHYAGQRLAIIADRSSYGVSLAAALRDPLVGQAAVPVVLEQSIDNGTKNFAAVIEQLKQARAEIVYFAGFPPEAGLLVKQAAQAGLKVQFFGGTALANRQFWDIAGPSAEGMIFTFVGDATLLTTAHDITAKLQARGLNPQGFTLYAYAAVQLFAAAIERAQSTEPAAVAAELQDGGLATVLGNVSFDENGDYLTPNWRVYRWNGDGHFKYVD